MHLLISIFGQKCSRTRLEIPFVARYWLQVEVECVISWRVPLAFLRPLPPMPLRAFSKQLLGKHSLLWQFLLGQSWDRAIPVGRELSDVEWSCAFRWLCWQYRLQDLPAENRNIHQFRRGFFDSCKVYYWQLNERSSITTWCKQVVRTHEDHYDINSRTTT